MGLDKLKKEKKRKKKKTLVFYLLSYTYIYLWDFLLLQPHHTTELCFPSLWLWVETTDVVSMTILMEKELLWLLSYLD